MKQTIVQDCRPLLSDQQITNWLLDQFERLLLLCRNKKIDLFLFDRDPASDDLERYAKRIQGYLDLHFGEDADDRGYGLLAKVIASFNGATDFVPERWESWESWESWMRFEEYDEVENNFLRATWNRLKPTSNSMIREIVETYFPTEKKKLLLSGLADERFHLAH